jgi:hypothetical protein
MWRSRRSMYHIPEGYATTAQYYRLSQHTWERKCKLCIGDIGPLTRWQVGFCSRALELPTKSISLPTCKGWGRDTPPARASAAMRSTQNLPETPLSNNMVRGLPAEHVACDKIRCATPSIIRRVPSRSEWMNIAARERVAQLTSYWIR